MGSCHRTRLEKEQTSVNWEPAFRVHFSFFMDLLLRSVDFYGQRLLNVQQASKIHHQIYIIKSICRNVERCLMSDRVRFQSSGQQHGLRFRQCTLSGAATASTQQVVNVNESLYSKKKKKKGACRNRTYIAVVLEKFSNSNELASEASV